MPIHAYPMLNHTQFPKRVDFGRCALGTRSSRHITMQCRIPIEFEFEVSWQQPVTDLGPLHDRLLDVARHLALGCSAAAVQAQVSRHRMSTIMSITHAALSACCTPCTGLSVTDGGGPALCVLLTEVPNSRQVTMQNQQHLNAALLQVKIVEENLAFEVEPLHGLVPADGAVQVAIHYTPSRMATDSMQLQVSCCLQAYSCQAHHCSSWRLLEMATTSCHQAAGVKVTSSC